MNSTERASQASPTSIQVVKRVKWPSHAVLALVLLVALAGVMALASAPALATNVYVPGVSFGSEGSGDGQFNEPAGVAVNDSTELGTPQAGDVYVVDEGNDRVEYFSAAGAYAGQFNGSATPAGSLSEPTGIAVDNSGKSVVEDPSVGDVYVVDAGHRVIDKFSSTGAYLGQITAGACPPAVFEVEEEACPPGSAVSFTAVHGVAVDRSGNLFVAYELLVPLGNGAYGDENVSEFSDTGKLISTFNAGGEGDVGLAIDSTDNVYIQRAGEAIRKYRPSGEEAWTAVNVEPVTALAVGPSTNNLLLDKGESIVLYGPFGEPYSQVNSVEVDLDPLETLPTEGLSSSYGLAVSATGTAYATERGAGVVKSFDYVPLPGASTEVASDVTETSLTLHGTVDPEGEEVTECYFEYGDQAGVYTNKVSCEPSAPFAGTAPAVHVSARVSGLPPGGPRSFRVVAGNANGTNMQANGMTISRPAIGGESLSGVGSIAAAVAAQVNPGGLATTYSIEYGTSVAYGSRSEPASLGAGDTGTEPVGASAQLSGLQPETVYHLRVVASNALGATDGSDFTLTTFPPPAPGLPDGRVYELVSSSPEGRDTDVYVPTPLAEMTNNEEHGIWTGLPFDVSSDGEAVVYAGDPPPTGGIGQVGGSFGDEYIARRLPGGGWAQTTLAKHVVGEDSGRYIEFSSDLSVGILELGEAIPGTGAPSNYINWYAHATGNGAEGEYRAVYTSVPDRSAHEVDASNEEDVDAPPFMYAGANAGTSAVPAFGHLLFEINAGLLDGEGQLETELGEDVATEVTEGKDRHVVHYLYDSVGGRAYLVDVLPDGKVAPGATFGSLQEQVSNGYTHPGFTRVISADGSRVFWTAAPEAHEHGEAIVNRSQGLYVRENDTRPQSPLNGEECTVPADACTVQVGPSGSIFQTASANGSKVFFTTSENELYEYDVETGETIELTPGVKVEGVAGTSKDGEYVYYVDSSGNIELWHAGVTTRVATEAGLGSATPFAPGNGGGGYHNDYITELGSRTAEVTPDGQGLIFMSKASLTGYDNVLGGAPLDEVYRYEASSEKLTCVSCNPSGEAPVPNEASIATEKELHEPVGAFFAISGQATYQPQSISADGSRVFFDSAEPLVPQATNGWVDDYEWERDGTGSCRTSGGCIYLISSGTDLENSYLIGTSASGDDVFFISRADLLAADRGGDDFVVYDARVAGVQPPAAPTCSGTGCQGVPPAPPIFATPSSVTFNGVGNFPPASPATSKLAAKEPVKCKKPRKLRHGKCVKAKKKKVTGKRSGRGVK